MGLMERITIAEEKQFDPSRGEESNCFGTALFIVGARDTDFPYLNTGYILNDEFEPFDEPKHGDVVAFYYIPSEEDTNQEIRGPYHAGVVIESAGGFLIAHRLKWNSPFKIEGLQEYLKNGPYSKGIDIIVDPKETLAILEGIDGAIESLKLWDLKLHQDLLTAERTVSKGNYEPVYFRLLH